jgi:hypothetical protein
LVCALSGAAAPGEDDTAAAHPGYVYRKPGRG